MKTKVIRYHDICAGHRVVGHEGKCRHLHGHNYRVHFHCEGEKLDNVGRVIDFSVVKSRLCMWLEEQWDHKFIVWENDQLMIDMMSSASLNSDQDAKDLLDSLVWVDFNPTAENLAQYLTDVVGPAQMKGTGIVLTKVTIEETRKCSVSHEI